MSNSCLMSFGGWIDADRRGNSMA